MPLYVFGTVLYKGINQFRISPYQALFVGIFLSVIILFILLIMDFGFLAWDQSTTWLSRQLRKYPKARRIVIFPLFITIILASIYTGIFNWHWDNLSRFVFLSYFGFAFPAAFVSIVKDDRTRHETRLSEQITRELILNNPQAAVEHAFTHFEDYLRKRLGVGPDLFSKRLIDYAFAKNGKLIFSEIESENEGVRNFVAGAYATFRNPRKHRIIQDDEQTTFAIISAIELLFKIVDESKDREEPAN